MRYPEHIRKAIRKREPFQSGQLVSYITQGGTYVIASTPLVNDDDQQHDLVAILPFHPQVEVGHDADGEPAAALVKLRPNATFDAIFDALETED